MAFADAHAITLDSGGTASMLTVVGGQLFWTLWGGGNVAGVMVMPAAGGPSNNLVSSEDAYAIAADDHYVFWTTVRSGTVMRATTLGDDVTMLASNQPDPRAIAIDRDFVYWANMAGGSLRRLPIAGGSVTTIMGGQASPAAIAVDAGTIYWSNDGDGTIMRLDL
jgi:streptogramin lyase